MTERCNERFFEMTAGNYCGVFIREDAAKKLQKILWRQTQEIKDFLTRNMDSLETANWTLAHVPEQKTVNYIDSRSREELADRIQRFEKADKLAFVKDVFKTDKSGLDAMHEAAEFYAEKYGSSEGGDAV